MESEKNTAKPTPQFSSYLFWDSDLKKIDYERDASYIIRRVFDLGRLEDVAESIRYYSDDLIVNTLLQANYLPENAIYLASALFRLKKEDFKCSTSKQYHPLF
ncbi:MAG: DUF6922 domain-containing protein [Saprospiraceae bacterium]